MQNLVLLLISGFQIATFIVRPCSRFFHQIHQSLRLTALFCGAHGFQMLDSCHIPTAICAFRCTLTLANQSTVLSNCAYFVQITAAYNTHRCQLTRSKTRPNTKLRKSIIVCNMSRETRSEKCIDVNSHDLRLG